MNAKISGILICVEVIIYLSLDTCTFKSKSGTYIDIILKNQKFSFKA